MSGQDFNLWKGRVRRSFDSGAAHYARYDAAQRRIAQRLASFLPDLGAGSSVLELGCGTGNLTQFLFERMAGSLLTITDQSDAMIEACRTRLAGADAGGRTGVRWAQVDAESLSESVIRDQAFDLIVSSMTAQWYVDFDAALARHRQFLNTGGQVLLAVPTHGTFKEWHDSLAHFGHDSGVLRFPVLADPIDEMVFQTSFPDGWGFLKMLKIMGVHTPRAGYHPIGVSALKRACTYFEDTYGASISWRIQIGRYTA